VSRAKLLFEGLKGIVDITAGVFIRSSLLGDWWSIMVIVVAIPTPNWIGGCECVGDYFKSELDVKELF